MSGFSVPQFQFNYQGSPASSGYVNVYQTGTTTPITIYADSALTTPLSNPLTLDANGECKFYIDGAVNLRMDGYTSTGILIQSIDPVYPLNSMSTQSASAVIISGGTINGTIIGNTTPAAGSFTSINGFQIAGFRNYLMNGAMNIWQRGTSFTPIAGTITYLADRWCALRASTAAITITQQSGSPPQGFKYYLRYSRNSGDTAINTAYLGYSLETLDSIALQGVPVTLSFDARCGANYSVVNSALTATIVWGTGADENVLNTYTGATVVGTKTVVLTTNWQRFSVSGTINATATEVGIHFDFTPTGTAGANDYFEIVGVQLEPGNGATPFEVRQFAIEKAMCLRYYEKSFPYATAPAQLTSYTGSAAVYLPTGASGTFGTTIPFFPKRTAPTVVTYNPSAANANWYDATNSASRSVLVGNIGEQSFQITGSSGVTGAANYIHWSASAEL